jgi:Glu-tRNA(Gln) amidotransferase subunit E-like FAD-binding protein
MFYVKEPLTDTLEVHVEINDKNVFCHCPVCGKEVQVDLEMVLREGEGDLCGTAVLCEACSQELMEVQGGNGPEA